MLLDLLIGAVVTLLLGLPVFVWGDQISDGPWKTPILVAALTISMAAGIATFARKYRERIVPIASIYIVVMFAVLLYLAFVIGWGRGKVEL